MWVQQKGNSDPLIVFRAFAVFVGFLLNRVAIDHLFGLFDRAFHFREGVLGRFFCSYNENRQDAIVVGFEGSG